MTLLSFTDGMTDVTLCSRRVTLLLMSSAVASPRVSFVPPTMTMSLIVFVLAASLIIFSDLVESRSRFFDDTYLASVVRHQV